MTLVLASAKYPAVMTCVYRLYDSAGALLYVGAAYDFDVRFAQHAAKKQWWPQVARRDVIWFNNRLDALYEEARAIATESPAYNDRPGTQPISLTVIYRPEHPHAPWHREFASTFREVAVSIDDRRRAVEEVTRWGAHAVVAEDGVPVGVLVPVVWLERVAAKAGDQAVIDHERALDVSTLC